VAYACQKLPVRVLGDSLDKHERSSERMNIEEAAQKTNLYNPVYYVIFFLTSYFCMIPAALYLLRDDMVLAGIFVLMGLCCSIVSFLYRCVYLLEKKVGV
jgi:hypothetical protein